MANSACLLNTKSFYCGLSGNLTQWPNTQTIRWQEPKTCLSEFDHYAGLALTGLTIDSTKKIFLRFFLRLSATISQI